MLTFKKEAALKLIFYSRDRDFGRCNQFSGNIPKGPLCQLISFINPCLIDQIVIPILAFDRIEPSNNVIVFGKHLVGVVIF